MKIVNELTENNFEAFLSETNKPIVVDFWADWCSPCIMQAPIFYELASDLKDKVLFAKVDIDQNEKLVQKYKITSVPCILLFKEGRLIGKTEGLTTKGEMAELLIKHV